MAYYWIIAAVVLFVIELFAGTVYLLVLSVSLLLAALVAWLFGTDAAMAAAAIFSLAGCIWMRQAKIGYTEPKREDDFDIGQTVVLEDQLATGEWRVLYRGTLWEARGNHSGSLKQGGTATIIGRDGNVLIVE